MLRLQDNLTTGCFAYRILRLQDVTPTLLDVTPTFLDVVPTGGKQKKDQRKIR